MKSVIVQYGKEIIKKYLGRQRVAWSTKMGGQKLGGLSGAAARTGEVNEKQENKCIK